MICLENQCFGFYLIGTSVMKELMAKNFITDVQQGPEYASAENL